MDSRYVQIRKIIGKSYERMYGPAFCNVLAERVYGEWGRYSQPGDEVQDDLANYLWSFTSGGGVAYATARKLRKEVV